MRLPNIWKGLRGSVYISDFHSIHDKNKHEVSDQTNLFNRLTPSLDTSTTSANLQNNITTSTTPLIESVLVEEPSLKSLSQIHLLKTNTVDSVKRIQIRQYRHPLLQYKTAKPANLTIKDNAAMIYCLYCLRKALPTGFNVKQKTKINSIS
ncbi:hypothetical protein M433DRAFT_503503 [Acidomyces richmondensis BFW]|nr:hypothetical protein M433DRAFT_503503 [Acidomyces richmondensis BFW]